MTVYALVNAAAATGAGDPVNFTGSQRLRDTYGPGIVQAIVTGVATAGVEGSIDGVNWSSIHSFTASDMKEITIPPYVRGNVTAWTSGTVTLKLEGPDRN